MSDLQFLDMRNEINGLYKIIRSDISFLAPRFNFPKATTSVLTVGDTIKEFIFLSKEQTFKTKTLLFLPKQLFSAYREQKRIFIIS